MQRIHVTIRPLNREDSVLYFPPEAFGPFRVLHQIGAGTLGPVFRAYEPAGDRLVAVKVFRLDVTPEQAAALVSELDTLVAAGINHPNVAAPIAAGLEHGTAYLAQEYAVGDSLDVVLRERGPMALGEIVALVDELAAAIDYAADRSMHHGSLHMRDIVLTSDAVRITGFGIASALSKIGARLPTRPQYLSTDAASDIYALGAIAFEAATGKRVSGEHLKEFEAEHGAKLRAAFDLPLSANPETRPLRAGGFAAALRAAHLGASGTTGALGAVPASRATVSPIAPLESVFASESAFTSPDNSNAPDAPTAPIAPTAPTDPLDPVIGLGTPDDFELGAPSDVTLASAPAVLPREVPSAWAAQPAQSLASDVEPEPSDSRWPIAALFLAFAVLAALSVGFFLRSPDPTPVSVEDPGVDATIVDLPATGPASPNAAAGKAAPNPAPNARNAPLAPGTPSPSPSRPASGAVRGTQTGSMLVRSTPADADVLVNGKPRGKTPLALRDLPLGSYNIRVTRDGYAPDERTLQLTPRRPTTSTTITLRSASARRAAMSASGASRSAPGASADRSVDGSADKAAPGGLNVQSRPAGARVFVNDRLAGSTPIAIPGLPAGPATVRIEMDGYQPWTTTVRVGAGAQTRVAASLERQ